MAANLVPHGLLRGRQDECSLLDDLIEGARTQRSATLLLRGEPGVGKTALLEYAIGSARDLRVVRVVGVESEMELAFAALQQLCVPLLDLLDHLADAQREALQTAFGLSTGPAPDRFFVGLALLNLLSEASADQPLLCVIDDAQWLDLASAQALGFVARRMLAEPVVLLFAAREPSDVFAGVPELMVEGLGAADARSLLESVIPGRLDEQIAGQIIAETRGNPLALLELPRALSPGQLTGGFGLQRAVRGTIEDRFRHRLETLPVDTQRLLLLAAAEPTGDPAVLWRAAEEQAIATSALAPAESAGLIEINSRVIFRHPLVRSALYGAATPQQRRDAHFALAQATDQADPDRRAWHLAEAAARPDEAVATELERAADRAQARGGLAAAGAFLERAAALTPEPPRRAQRALAAARVKLQAGAVEDAIALLDRADAGSHYQAERASVDLVRAQIAYVARRGNDAAPLLLKAARELTPLDPVLARNTYLEALSAALIAGRFAGPGGTPLEVSQAALAGPPMPGAPSASDLLLQGLALRLTEGDAAGMPLLKQAMRDFQRDELRAGDAQWSWFAAWIALLLWDDAAWTVLSAHQLEAVRHTGAVTALPFALANRSTVMALGHGDIDGATSLEHELRIATEATGLTPVTYGAMALAVARGREADFLELAKSSVPDAEARGEGNVLTVSEFLGGFLYNGLGRYDEALAATRPAESFSMEAAGIFALTELVEAAVHVGQPQSAAHALERITDTTQAAGTDWGLGIEARMRALLTDGGEAETLYEEAIERLGRTSIRMQLARTQLLYGEWLRRERRNVDAREQLRTAHELFASMGAEGFAARAERELVATGEHRARRHSAETREQLTPQEGQIARLARDGLSNREIAARLFVSPHTVAYHLHKVFSKLDIASRHQLAGALPDGEDGQVLGRIDVDGRA